MPIDPLTLAIGAGAVTGLANGIGNIIGVNRANNQNLRIARETNELNYQMFKENEVYQTDMWRLQNKYNTPLAQKERLREAGYSPYLLVGTPQMSGVSSSLPNGGMQSAVTGAPMQPVPYGDVVSKPLEMLMQIQNLERGEISKQREKTELGVETATFFDKIQKLRAESDTALTGRAIAELQRAYQESINKFSDERQRAELRNLYAQEFENYARGGLETIQENIASQYGFEEASWKVKQLKKSVSHLSAQIEYYHELGLTEKETRNKLRSDEYLNHILSLLNLSKKEEQDLTNELFRQVFKYKKGLFALDFLSGREDYHAKQMQNSFTRLYGSQHENAKLEIENAMGEMLRETSRNRRVDTRLKEKELDQSDLKFAVGVTKDLISSVKSLPEGKLTEENVNESFNNLRFEFIRKMQFEGYSRSDSKYLFDEYIAPKLLE